MSDSNTYPRCIDCERPMRKQRTKLADHPGTVSHNSHGRCAGCAEALRRQGLAPKKPKTVMDVKATTASLMAYHAWRAPCRAKASQ